MRKYMIPIICLSLLAFSSPAIAETKTFLKEYTYQASEFDSKASSRILAVLQRNRHPFTIWLSHDQLRKIQRAYLDAYDRLAT